jgi:Arc/MetJ family transcription regulator
MRISLNVDERLLDEVLEATQARTKTEAVHRALTEYLRLWRKQRLLASRGQWDIDDDNWQALRALEMSEEAGRPVTSIIVTASIKRRPDHV